MKNVDLLTTKPPFTLGFTIRTRLTGHSTAQQAATVALKASVGKLLIGHFSSRYKNEKDLQREAMEIFPATEVVNDGLTFSVEPKSTY